MNRFTQEIKIVKKMMINETDKEKVRRIKHVIKDIKRYKKKMDKLFLQLEDNPAREVDIDNLYDEFTSFQDSYPEYIEYYNEYYESDSEDELIIK